VDAEVVESLPEVWHILLLPRGRQGLRHALAAPCCHAHSHVGAKLDHLRVGQDHWAKLGHVGLEGQGSNLCGDVCNNSIFCTMCARNVFTGVRMDFALCTTTIHEKLQTNTIITLKP
jgi:hypothetical protein